MGRLDGKTALVTGGARGSGAAIATRFVREGARVVIVDVLDELGNEHARGCGANARYLHLDVAQEAEWARVVGDVQDREGRLDILVNNAAILHLSVIDATTAEMFDRVMAVNVRGAFLGTKACLPLLRRGGGGAIVNIGSIDSVQGTPATVAYTASKYAILGLTKVTAVENGKYRIRANCVCPGWGSQEMLVDARRAPDASLPWTSTAAATGEMPENTLKFPLGAGDCADIAAAALYFASDDSSHCSGAELVVDGGHLAGAFIDIPGVFSTGHDR